MHNRDKNSAECGIENQQLQIEQHLPLDELISEFLFVRVQAMWNACELLTAQLLYQVSTHRLEFFSCVTHFIFFFRILKV